MFFFLSFYFTFKMEKKISFKFNLTMINKYFKKT